MTGNHEEKDASVWVTEYFDHVRPHTERLDVYYPKERALKQGTYLFARPRTRQLLFPSTPLTPLTQQIRGAIGSTKFVGS